MSLPVTLGQQAGEELCLCSNHSRPSSDNSPHIPATAPKEGSAEYHAVPNPEGVLQGPPLALPPGLSADFDNTELL